MPKHVIRRGLLAVALSTAALGATILPAGVAQAKGKTTTYTLTPKEKKNACGNFGGTIVFGDGSSLDCHSGVATLPVES